MKKNRLNDSTPDQWDSAWKASYKSKEVPATFDIINKPKHYNSGEVECIVAMQSMLTPEEFRGYLRGNSFKYRWRYPDKNGIEDISKAEWYETKLLEVLGSNGQ